MPFQFPTTAPPPYEDQAPVEGPLIISVLGTITVLGNCGVIHGSVEEWQQCAWCACGPKSLKYERFDR